MDFQAVLQIMEIVKIINLFIKTTLKLMNIKTMNIKLFPVLSMGYKSHNIKPNKIQGEVEKTNYNEYISKHLNAKKIKEWKKPIKF